VLPDVKDETITLTENKLVFKGTSNGKPYTADLELFAALDEKDEVRPRGAREIRGARRCARVRWGAARAPPVRARGRDRFYPPPPLLPSLAPPPPSPRRRPSSR